jgi:acyl-CoA dehydrogenase
MQYQSYAYGKNHWSLEPDLPAILARYWPSYQEHQDEFEDFGALVGSKVYEVADYVDHHAPPTLVMHDLDGQRVDRARLCPAHLDLLKQLAVINRPPYGNGSWHHHFTLAYLLADPGLYCSLIVTNQTAYALHKYAPEHGDIIEQLLAGQAWGATWMTETQGGSDLGTNNTIAKRAGDHAYRTGQIFRQQRWLGGLRLGYSPSRRSPTRTQRFGAFPAAARASGRQFEFQCASF